MSKNIWEAAEQEQRENEEELSEEVIQKIEEKKERLAENYLKGGAGRKELTKEGAIKFTNICVKNAQKWMRGEFHEDGKPHELVQSAVIFGKYGDVVPFPMVWDSHEEKIAVFNAMADMIRRGFKRGVIKGYLVILDARMKHLEGVDAEQKVKEFEENFTPGSIADDKSAPEGLIAILSMPGEKPYVIVNRYTRDEKGLPVFEEIKQAEDGDFSGALMPTDLWE